MKKEISTEWSYLPISHQVIKDAWVRGDAQVIDERLSNQGLSEVLIYMIRQGYVRQLRADCFKILSEVLGCNIGVS